MPKLLRTLVIAVLLALPALAQAEAALTGSALWIGVDQAPVRIWRSAEAEVVLRLPRGTVVQLSLIHI